MIGLHVRGLKKTGRATPAPKFLIHHPSQCRDLEASSVNIPASSDACVPGVMLTSTCKSIKGQGRIRVLVGILDLTKNLSLGKL